MNSKRFFLAFFTFLLLISFSNSQIDIFSENSTSGGLSDGNKELISFRHEVDPNAFTITTTTTIEIPIERYSYEYREGIKEDRVIRNIIENATLVEDKVEDSVQCGNSDLVCSIENDLTGDGIMDCCDVTNNNVCRACRSQCIEECAKDGKVVQTCFMDVIRPVCQCVESYTSCYTYVSTTLPENASENITQQESGENSISYLLILGLIFIAFGASVHFIYKADRE